MDFLVQKGKYGAIDKTDNLKRVIMPLYMFRAHLNNDKTQILIVKWVNLENHLLEKHI